MNLVQIVCMSVISYKLISHIFLICSQSYVSILYLRIPPGFRMILRGRDVEHHNVVNDMMQTEHITYRPQYGVDGFVKDSNVMLQQLNYIMTSYNSSANQDLLAKTLSCLFT